MHVQCPQPPRDASLVLLGTLVSLLVEKTSLGEAVEKQNQPTAAAREKHGYNHENNPAFGAVKPIMGNVSAEKAKVGSV